MSPLKQYTDHLIIIRAHEAICKDLHRAALRELKKFGFSITVHGVDLTISQRFERKYPRAIQKRINKLVRQLRIAKVTADFNPRTKTSVSATFIKGTVRKSLRRQVFGRVPAYRKHFDL